VKVWEFTKEYGAICHPQAREYLMKDVIEELKRRCENTDRDEFYNSDVMYEEAITLIKEGVKK
jgi:hypothetical protein